MNYNYSKPVQAQSTRQEEVPMQAFYDPYVYETLQSIIGATVVIETEIGSVHGEIKDVKPDHVVLESHGKLFFVRTKEIVWIMPIQ